MSPFWWPWTWKMHMMSNQWLWFVGGYGLRLQVLLLQGIFQLTVRSIFWSFLVYAQTPRRSTTCSDYIVQIFANPYHLELPCQPIFVNLSCCPIAYAMSLEEGNRVFFWTKSHLEAQGLNCSAGEFPSNGAVVQYPGIPHGFDVRPGLRWRKRLWGWPNNCL